MTTDPGDLVLDPTCGSGTTAYVAEHSGRRWMTIDTSRIALNIAKTRLMTAVFPYFHLYSDVQVEVAEKNGKIIKKVSPRVVIQEESSQAKPSQFVIKEESSQPEHGSGGFLLNDKKGERGFLLNDKNTPPNDKKGDVREGFVYEEVPHITLKSLANDEPPATEILYDRPLEDKSRLRVAGPFTVETLQSDEILPPETLAGEHRSDPNSPFRGPGGAGDGGGNFEERIFEHLKAAGIMNGAKQERAIFTRVERLNDAHLHAEGFYQSANGERKAYLHIGPQFGTVSKDAVNKSLRECRSRGDADWLIILGFSFESDISNQSVTTTVGSFEVTKVRMHDDLLQEGLTKKDKKAASFVTIGEPDVKTVDGERLTADGQRTVQVVIEGLDIYDPIRDEIRSRSLHDIAYWMVDDDYDGSNFIVRQVFFCGGDKDEFRKWQKGISDVSARLAKAHAQRMLKIELDDEAWERLYGFKSHPILKTPGRKIAVRVVSQFGEESMKVLGV